MQCNNCRRLIDKDSTFQCVDKDRVYFECVDETTCKRLTEELKSRTEAAAELALETKFMSDYGFSRDKLVKLNTRFRHRTPYYRRGDIDDLEFYRGDWNREIKKIPETEPIYNRLKGFL